MCEEHAAAELPAVKGATTKWCLWECPICKCRCKCTFEQDKRYTIHESLKANAKKEDELKNKNGNGGNPGYANNSDSGQEIFFSRLQYHRDEARDHEALCRTT